MLSPHLKSVSLKSYGMLSPSVLNLRRSSSTLWKYARANSSFWYLPAAQHRGHPVSNRQLFDVWFS